VYAIGGFDFFRLKDEKPAITRRRSRRWERGGVWTRATYPSSVLGDGLHPARGVGRAERADVMACGTLSHTLRTFTVTDGRRRVVYC